MPPKDCKIFDPLSVAPCTKPHSLPFTSWGSIRGFHWCNHVESHMTHIHAMAIVTSTRQMLRGGREQEQNTIYMLAKTLIVLLL